MWIVPIGLILEDYEEWMSCRCGGSEYPCLIQREGQIEDQGGAAALVRSFESPARDHQTLPTMWELNRCAHRSSIFNIFSDARHHQACSPWASPITNVHPLRTANSHTSYASNQIPELD